MPLPSTSHENLVHFNCPICQKWWSIGDAPERDHWYCPWCGEKLSDTDESLPLEKLKNLIDQLEGNLKKLPNYEINMNVLQKIEERQLKNNK